jgi:chemotaxis protein MotA
MSQGASPRDVINGARRILGTDCRPTQAELKKLFGEA